MRLATVVHPVAGQPSGTVQTTAARVEDDAVVLLEWPDVGAVLRSGSLAPAGTAKGTAVSIDSVDFKPVVTRPDKIVCVGKNYQAHAEEMAGKPAKSPTYFAKYARALIGPYDDIILPDPKLSAGVDWEGELAIVIGQETRHASSKEAAAAIAGFIIFNDVSMRNWQYRTSQFLAGKTFEASTPVGPAMVTPDEIGDGSGLQIRTEVNGVVKQLGSTTDMIFDPVDIIRDLSTIITLDPGDIIATGTPSGVGHARTPPEYLTVGDQVTVSIDGLGTINNSCVNSPAQP